MSAYVLSFVTPINTEQFEAYREIAKKSMEVYGGRYVVRGGDIEVAEGSWPEGQAVVMMEFQDMDTLHTWYESPEYAPAREISKAALHRQLLFIEGVTR